MRAAAATFLLVCAGCQLPAPAPGGPTVHDLTSFGAALPTGVAKGDRVALKVRITDGSPAIPPGGLLDVRPDTAVVLRAENKRCGIDMKLVREEQNASRLTGKVIVVEGTVAVWFHAPRGGIDTALLEGCVIRAR